MFLRNRASLVIREGRERHKADEFEVGKMPLPLGPCVIRAAEEEEAKRGNEIFEPPNEARMQWPRNPNRMTTISSICRNKSSPGGVKLFSNELIRTKREREIRELPNEPPRAFV